MIRTIRIKVEMCLLDRYERKIAKIDEKISKVRKCKYSDERKRSEIYILEKKKLRWYGKMYRITG